MSKISSPAEADVYLTEAELRRMLGGISRGTVRNWELAGILPARFKIGPGARAVRFSRAAVLAMMRERHEEAQAKAQRARTRDPMVWVDQVSKQGAI